MRAARRRRGPLHLSVRGKRTQTRATQHECKSVDSEKLSAKTIRFQEKQVAVSQRKIVLPKDRCTLSTLGQTPSNYKDSEGEA